ncbi:FAD-binding protein [Serratia marcescens]|uniref:FAD-binding protein n=1 Tax=Serratia marcescens TaxID=615 RepID=A0A939SR50_SERMA|nr:FAD-binding protein [Serratia marcescens]
MKADVIVVGAGFAGLSTALELRALGRRSSCWSRVRRPRRQWPACRLPAGQHGNRSTRCSSNG